MTSWMTRKCGPELGLGCCCCCCCHLCPSLCVIRPCVAYVRVWHSSLCGIRLSVYVHVWLDNCVCVFGYVSLCLSLCVFFFVCLAFWHLSAAGKRVLSVLNVSLGFSAVEFLVLLFPLRKFHKKLGQQAWLVAAITVTEFLIVVKYDPHTITLPIPFSVTQCWILGMFLIFSWTLWRFFFR